MALKVWLKLNGNLKNSGLKKMSFTNVDNHTYYYGSDGVYDGSYENDSFVSGGVISNETISLGQKHSMFCWFRFKTLNNNSSLGAGLVTQHRYENNRGTGITIKYVSSTTGYLSVNTGNGSSRTYNTYCGTTLLQANTWYHGGFTYDGQYIRIYVNGVCEKVQEYPNMSVADDNIALFCWSLKNNSSVPHPNYKLNGRLDDVRIYDNCLTDYDVERLYNGHAKILQVCLPFHKDCRNVGLENVKATSAGTFQIVSDTTGLKCAKFGTSTGYVKIPHDIFKKNTEMSMTFSINFNSWNTAWATPIGIFKNSNAWTGNTFTFLRNNTGQTFCFNISNGTSSTQSNLKTGNLSLSTWYHFACVYKDRKMSLYQNGNLVGTYTPTFDPSFTAATLAIVGASTTGGSYQTDSKMSNVRFYNLALTDRDVKRIYQNYEILEYLEFNGAQYVSLPKQTSNDKIKIIFDFCPDSLTHSQPTFMGIAGKSFQLYRSSTTAISLWWKSNGAYSIGTFNPDSHNILELNFDSNTFSYNFNGTSNSYSNTELYPIVKAGNILIGGYNPGTSYPFFGKIYRIKVYSDNVLTLDLIPCKKNNIKQFFDKVSTNYYQSSSNPF